MRDLRAVLVYILGLAVLSAATPVLQGGPWQLWQADGSLLIGVEVAGTLEPSDVVGVHLRKPDGRDWLLVPALAEQEVLKRPLRQPSTVLRWMFPAQQVPQGTLSIQAEYREGPLQDEARARLALMNLPPRPAPSSGVRVVFCGAWNYPTQGELESLSAHLGGAPDVVVVLGAQSLALRLGHGGWEQRIPIAILDAQKADPTLQPLVGAEGLWQQGLRVGLLGLPAAADGALASIAIHEDGSPWQMYCDLGMTWNPGLDGEGDALKAQGLRQILAACLRRQVPMVISAGNACGAVSEPLSVAVDFEARFARALMDRTWVPTQALRLAQDEAVRNHRRLQEQIVLSGVLDASRTRILVDQVLKDIQQELTTLPGSGLVIRPGGTRVALVGGAGAPFAHIPDEIALPLRTPTLSGVVVNHEMMEWILEETASSERRALRHWRLRWQRTPEGQLSGSGPGLGLPDPSAYLQPGSKAPSGEELQAATWVPLSVLSQALATPDKVARLMDLLLVSRGGEDLLRRLSALHDATVASWLRSRTGVPVDFESDWVLRRLYDEHPLSEMLGIISRTTDHPLLQAVLRRLDQLPTVHRLPLVQTLLIRLQAQLDGKLAMDHDPLIEHALMGAIFDGRLLPATTLEHVALPALERVGALARAPIRRWLLDGARDGYLTRIAQHETRPGVLNELLLVCEGQTQSLGAGALVLGWRLRLQGQATGALPLLDPELQGRMLHVVMADPAWNGLARESTLDLLRRRYPTLIPAGS